MTTTTGATQATAAPRPVQACSDPSIWVPDPNNPDLCATCWGAGWFRYRTTYRRCDVCDGTGWYRHSHPHTTSPPG